jgi:DNA-binding NarL/FixJ family response regulator
MAHSGINDGIRILLVDDHPAVRTGIRSMLAKAPDIEVVAEAEEGPWRSGWRSVAGQTCCC